MYKNEQNSKLGLLYKEGQEDNLHTNADQARRYFQLVANNNYSEAKNVLSEVRLSKTSGEIS